MSLDYHDKTYPRYVELNGNEACDICFGSNMSGHNGGSGWSEISCSGERESLTLWSDSKPKQANCHDPETQCKIQNKYLEFDTRDNATCSDMEFMIETGHFPRIVTKYNSITCTTNESYWIESHDTAGNFEGAVRMWREHYYYNCKSKLNDVFEVEDE